MTDAEWLLVCSCYASVLIIFFISAVAGRWRDDD